MLSLELKQAAAVAEQAGWTLDHYDDKKIIVSTTAQDRHTLSRRYFLLAEKIKTCKCVGMQKILDEGYYCVVQFVRG